MNAQCLAIFDIKQNSDWSRDADCTVFNEDSLLIDTEDTEMSSPEICLHEGMLPCVMPHAG